MLTIESLEQLNLFLIVKEGLMESLMEELSLFEYNSIDSVMISLKEAIDDANQEEIEEPAWLDYLYAFIGYDLGETHTLLSNGIESTSDLKKYLEKVVEGVSFNFSIDIKH